MDLNKRGLEQSVDATFEIKPKISKLSKKRHLTQLYNLARQNEMNRLESNEIEEMGKL